MSVDLDKLNTEQRNEKAANLDKMTPIEIVQLVNEQDCTIKEKVRAILVTPQDGLYTLEGSIRKKYPVMIEGECYKAYFAE